MISNLVCNIWVCNFQTVCKKSFQIYISYSFLIQCLIWICSTEIHVLFMVVGFHIFGMEDIGELLFKFSCMTIILVLFLTVVWPYSATRQINFTSLYKSSMPLHTYAHFCSDFETRFWPPCTGLWFLLYVIYGNYSELDSDSDSD